MTGAKPDELEAALRAEVRRLRRVVAEVGDGYTADDECGDTVIRRPPDGSLVQFRGICHLPLCHDGDHKHEFEL